MKNNDCKYSLRQRLGIINNLFSLALALLLIIVSIFNDQLS